MAELQIDAATFSLPLDTLIYGDTEAHNNFLAAGGYSGIQLAYVRRVLHPQVALELAEQHRVHSLHQSFVVGCRPTDFAQRLLLSNAETSLDKLAKIQSVTGKLPLVAHPNEQWLANRPPRNRTIDYESIQQADSFQALLYQPTVELMLAWHALEPGELLDPETSADRLLHAQKHYGFDTIALDIHHLLSKRAGEQLGSRWVTRFAGALAARGALRQPAELQLAFQPDSNGELASLTTALLDDGLEEGMYATIIHSIAASMPSDQKTMRITVEVRASAVQQAIRSDSRLTGLTLQTAHRRLTNALKAGPLAA